MNIIFMGTPDFSVSCLEELLNSGHNISAVFTREDKPVGRKQVMTAPPVKVFAQEHNLRVIQPKTLKSNTEVIDTIKEINPDIIVVVAYGRILPSEILEIPKYGCVNVHASLLPKYRGASPIQWSIISGDNVTGVTTMLMDEGMDTGDILETAEIPILPQDTAETLFNKLSKLGAKLIVSTVDKLKKGQINPRKQPEQGVSYAPIIKKSMGELDFNRPAAELYNLIRGFTPWPLAYFKYNDRRYKIFSASPDLKSNLPVGSLFYSENAAFVVCGDQMTLRINEICPDGSKKMDAKAFINGRFIENKTKLL